jgi:nitrite reductase/ring-hydroxylating ferredoxin subunit
MAAAPAWFDADGVASLPLDAIASAHIAGRDLMIANVDGTLLAYADACASCGSPLHGGELVGGALACPGCGRTFILPRAGRSADDERLQLEPVPLLREDGHVRVALAG